MDDIVERLDYEIAEAMSVIEDQIDGDLTTEGRGRLGPHLIGGARRHADAGLREHAAETR